MHRGRLYPYHPRYWAAPAWFWPGHVPWKLFIERTGPLNPPWNILPDPFSVVSDKGQGDSSADVMNYVANAETEFGPVRFWVAMDRLRVGLVLYARWRMTIGRDATGWSTAFRLQDYPQHQVLLDAWDYCLPAPPYTSESGPNLKIRPATYAEGGSPWPRSQ